jgi:hypothetical protein
MKLPKAHLSHEAAVCQLHVLGKTYKNLSAFLSWCNTAVAEMEAI